MKLIYAPMATLSHEPMRRLVERFGGCDEHYTEMIHAPSLLHGGQFEKYYLLHEAAPEKIVWQLTGTEPVSMAEAAVMVSQLGGIGIDLNMGCSAPDIARFGAGISWMLKSRDETRTMVEAVKKVMPENLRLSVKMRLGDEDFTMQGLFDFTDMLIDCGVSQLVLHPRTKKEKYTRPPKISLLKPFVEHVREKNPDVKVIGNGAVHDAASFDAMLRVSPDLDGVMIGRAAAQKPWIFAEIARARGLMGHDRMQVPAGELPVDLFEVAEQFTEDLQKFQPPEFYDSRARRFFSFFLDNFMYSHFLKTKVLNTKIREEQLAAIKEYLDKMPEERFRKI
ncbi:MAG: tRNA-dihydrouridine synthase family protein [Treponemataceae bacterium]|nr:tRNA-dihydrouridine synthase family protein [Treponemataceae bacterium]